MQIIISTQKNFWGLKWDTEYMQPGAMYTSKYLIMSAAAAAAAVAAVFQFSLQQALG